MTEVIGVVDVVTADGKADEVVAGTASLLAAPSSLTVTTSLGLGGPARGNLFGSR